MAAAAGTDSHPGAGRVQNALSVIKSPAGIKTAASIQPVEFQHHT
jgi:hypothetical protein